MVKSFLIKIHPSFAKLGKLKGHCFEFKLWGVAHLIASKSIYYFLSLYNHFIKYRQARDRLTVLIPTFNAQNTLAAAIDSVLKQKTNYTYKIIIADDCSKDNTVNIIKEYAARYPEIITPIFRMENLGNPFNHHSAAQHIDTEYFCILDDDDLYTDNNKLQIQIDIMDKNLACSMCSHDTILQKENTQEKIPDGNYKTGVYRLPFYVHTSSKMIRSTVLKKLENKYKGLIDDNFLNYMAMLCGNRYHINKSMSVYNWTGVGVYSSLNDCQVKQLNIIGETILYFYMKKLFINRNDIDPALLKDKQRMLAMDYHREVAK